MLSATRPLYDLVELSNEDLHLPSGDPIYLACHYKMNWFYSLGESHSYLSLS